MVALQLPTGATEAEYDVGCSWEELADKQAAGGCGELTIESAEDGDCALRCRTGWR